MVRRSEPWYREERKAWYVRHEGRQGKLAADKDEAFAKWHDPMALSRVSTAGDKNPFRAVAEQWLDWIRRNKKRRTYKVDKLHLQTCCDVHGDVQLRDLKAIHVDEVLKANAHWGRSTQRSVMVCILTCLNWAVRQGIATRTPLHKRLTIPSIVSRSRDTVVSAEDYEKMIAHANERLRDFIIACRNTGTRRHIIASVTAKHFDEAASAGSCPNTRRTRPASRWSSTSTRPCSRFPGGWWPGAPRGRCS